MAQRNITRGEAHLFVREILAEGSEELARFAKQIKSQTPVPPEFYDLWTVGLVTRIIEQLATTCNAVVYHSLMLPDEANQKAVH